MQRNTGGIFILITVPLIIYYLKIYKSHFDKKRIYVTMTQFVFSLIKSFSPRYAAMAFLLIPSITARKS